MIHMISVRLKQENNRRKLHIVFAYYLATYLQVYKYTLLRVNVQKLSEVFFYSATEVGGHGHELK